MPDLQERDSRVPYTAPQLLTLLDLAEDVPEGILPRTFGVSVAADVPKMGISVKARIR
jgi:hypothetical protein